MKTIPLSQGLVCLVDDNDYEYLAQWSWHAVMRGSHHKKWYATAWLDSKKKVYMHRFLTMAPQKQPVDHIDGDGLNNQRSNLRVVNSSLNGHNRSRHHPRNKSGVRGVCWIERNRKWRAQIGLNMKVIYIGLFSSKEDAAKARKEFEIAHNLTI